MEENYQWLLRVIDSCLNEWQLQTALKMIKQFEARYNNGIEYNSLVEAYLKKDVELSVRF